MGFFTCLTKEIENCSMKILWEGFDKDDHIWYHTIILTNTEVLLMEKVFTELAPAAIGPYSQAMKVGSLVYTSGQIPIDPKTGAVEAQDIAGQTRQVMENLKAVLEAAGSSMDKAVKTLCFLTDMSNFAAFNEIYGQYFTGKPARSCVAVSALPKGVLVEVEVVAELG